LRARRVFLLDFFFSVCALPDESHPGSIYTQVIANVGNCVAGAYSSGFTGPIETPVRHVADDADPFPPLLLIGDADAPADR
jgi:hypothetical protein